MHATWTVIAMVSHLLTLETCSSRTKRVQFLVRAPTTAKVINLINLLPSRTCGI